VRCRGTETFPVLLAWSLVNYSFCCSFFCELISYRYDSQRQIGDLDELVAVDDAFAPDGVEIGERFFRDGFHCGFSRGLQFLNAIAEVTSMSRDFVRSALLPERAVARNDLGVIVGERENFVGRQAIMPLILPPVPGVDVGVHTVEKRVAHLNHVGLLKMNVDVRIRMRGSKVLEREGFAIGLQLVTVGEGLLRQGLRGRRVEMQVVERAVCVSIQDRQIMRLGHALLSVFVGKDRGSCGVKMRVVIGMVEVPVGVDDAFTGALPRPSRASLSLGQAGKTKVSHHEFAVRAVEDCHGSAGAVELVTFSASFCVSMGTALNLARILASRSPPKVIVARRSLRKRGAASRKRGAPGERCLPTSLSIVTFRDVRFPL